MTPFFLKFLRMILDFDSQGFMKIPIVVIKEVDPENGVKMSFALTIAQGFSL